MAELGAHRFALQARVDERNHLAHVQWPKQQNMCSHKRSYLQLRQKYIHEVCLYAAQRQPKPFPQHCVLMQEFFPRPGLHPPHHK